MVGNLGSRSDDSPLPALPVSGVGGMLPGVPAPAGAVGVADVAGAAPPGVVASRLGSVVVPGAAGSVFCGVSVVPGTACGAGRAVPGGAVGSCVDGRACSGVGCRCSVPGGRVASRCGDVVVVAPPAGRGADVCGDGEAPRVAPVDAPPDVEPGADVCADMCPKATAYAVITHIIVRNKDCTKEIAATLESSTNLRS